jgi:hypothetical protein
VCEPHIKEGGGADLADVGAALGDEKLHHLPSSIVTQHLSTKVHSDGKLQMHAISDHSESRRQRSGAGNKRDRPSNRILSTGKRVADVQADSTRGAWPSGAFAVSTIQAPEIARELIVVG